MSRSKCLTKQAVTKKSVILSSMSVREPPISSGRRERLTTRPPQQRRCRCGGWMARIARAFPACRGNGKNDRVVHDSPGQNTRGESAVSSAVSANKPPMEPLIPRSADHDPTSRLTKVFGLERALWRCGGIAKRARRRPKALASRRCGRVCGPSAASKSFDDAPHRLRLSSCPTGRLRDLYGS